MQLLFKPYTLNFIRPFRIAHGIRSSTPIVIVELMHNGMIGYGEASMPPYLGESHETALAFLKKAQSVLNRFNDPFDIGSILNEIDKIDSGNTAAKASIDIALHDLIGKIKNIPCWELFEADRKNAPFTSYTLGIDEPQIIKQKIVEANEYKVLKIKLDGNNDMLTIETIRNLTSKTIAIDVNQGWKDKQHALDMIHWLADKNVSFIEQPLPKFNYDDANWLFERSPLPLFADESVQRIGDLDRIKNCFHGINIKLMKCTGLHEAHKMIMKAKELNLKILMGCMSESSCGISAAAQLSPLTDHADLDGALLVSNDMFEGITFNQGQIILNQRPGIGVIRKGEG